MWTRTVYNANYKIQIIMAKYAHSKVFKGVIIRKGGIVSLRKIRTQKFKFSVVWNK